VGGPPVIRRLSDHRRRYVPGSTFVRYSPQKKFGGRTAASGGTLHSTTATGCFAVHRSFFTRAVSGRKIQTPRSFVYIRKDFVLFTTTLCLIKYKPMEIKDLKNRPNTDQNDPLYTQFKKLLAELKKKELSEEVISPINSQIDQINAVSESPKELRKQLKKSLSTILKFIEKEYKIVPKNHYRNTWLGVGMAAFGVPIGVAFGASFGNMAFIAIGIPIGMVIGMAVGSRMDKKAFKEGRQLDLEIE
jgi:hypothetical protein